MVANIISIIILINLILLNQYFLISSSWGFNTFSQVLSPGKSSRLEDGKKIFSSFASNLLLYNKKTTFTLPGLFFWKYMNINYIFISPSTLNIPVKDIEWLNGYETHIYAAYKTLTSDLKIHRDWKWGYRKRYSM